MISLSAAVYVIIALIIAGIIFYVLHWAIGYIGLPEPFNKVARVVLVLLAVIVVCAILLSLIGYPVIRP